MVPADAVEEEEEEEDDDEEREREGSEKHPCASKAATLLPPMLPNTHCAFSNPQPTRPRSCLAMAANTALLLLKAHALGMGTGHTPAHWRKEEGGRWALVVVSGGGLAGKGGGSGRTERWAGRTRPEPGWPRGKQVPLC
mmetsp:Transcript_18720/g.37833  ORF Transcript_18720/g.37833 Transcript_18720/m.37833 type:complete len:139 (-) Transcript_18720:520-936(-)